MISVAQALDDLFALVKPLDTELVPLSDAAGRTLASDVTARRDQPPFAGSAMDGYAIKSTQAHVGATFQVIGESAAGHAFTGALNSGEAVRIFTGAPLPEGADHVVIQEETDRDGDTITITDRFDTSPNVRAKGSDFKVGDIVSAPRRLTPADIALLAAMNIAEVPVTRRPDIALISTGDELVMPGEVPAPDQIIVSNTFGLKALLEEHGATVRMLPIARDTESALKTVFCTSSFSRPETSTVRYLICSSGMISLVSTGPPPSAFAFSSSAARSPAKSSVDRSTSPTRPQPFS